MTSNRRTPLARLSMALFCLAVVALIGAVLAIRGEWVPVGQGFVAMAAGALVMLVFAAVSLVTLLVRLARGRGVQPRLVVYVAVGMLPLLLFAATVGLSGLRAPPIHDITTDLDDPPAFAFAAADRPVGVNPVVYDAAVSAPHQRRAYPHIEPLYLPLEPARALALAVTVMEASGWRMLGVDAATGTAEGVYRSAIFGFQDDVVVRVQAASPGSRIDVRSASRVGRGDLGANAARVERFLATLEKKAKK